MEGAVIECGMLTVRADDCRHRWVEWSDSHFTDVALEILQGDVFQTKKGARRDLVFVQPWI